MTNPSVIEALHAVMDERAWGQFQSPENVAKDIVVETGELLACFR